jgi:hypothetical protein
MSFDVFVIPSTASPPQAQFERAVHAAIVAEGGRFLDRDGESAQTSDGVNFELYGGGGFTLRGLTPSLCTLIFRTAVRTKSYVYATGGPDFMMKIKGVPGRPTGDMGAIRTVADQKAFCAVLQQGYSGWSSFANAAHKALQSGAVK